MGTTHDYDAANRLSAISSGAATTTYVYNGDGDRVSQTVSDGTSPGTLTTYVLDTATPLTMVLSETTGGSTKRYWHGLDMIGQSDGISTEYFAYDGLGSVRQLIGESGSVQLAQTFDAYGNGYAKAGSVGSSFGYSGEQVDANGFIYLRARYYSPSMSQTLRVYNHVESMALATTEHLPGSPAGRRETLRVFALGQRRETRNTQRNSRARRGLARTRCRSPFVPFVLSPVCAVCSLHKGTFPIMI